MLNGAFFSGSSSYIRHGQFLGCSQLRQKTTFGYAPLSNFANKLPTTPERRYSGRYGLELFKTVRLAFIGSIVVEISYEKVPQGDFFRKS